MTSLYSTLPILYRVCIFFSHNKESSAPYLKLLDVLNIESIFILKISQNETNIPEVFENYLVKVSDIHSHNTTHDYLTICIVTIL